MDRLGIGNDQQVEQAPSHCHQAENHSLHVSHVLYSLVLSCFSCFLYIYKRNYRAIVLVKEVCREVSGLQILF